MSTSEPQTYTMSDLGKLVAKALVSNLDNTTLVQVECSDCLVGSMHVCQNKLRPMVIEALRGVFAPDD